MRKVLKYIASKSFHNGLKSCNDLGEKLVTQKPIQRFLDTGCGNGNLTIEFAKIAKAKELYGIEFVDERKQQAELKGIKCAKQDLNRKWNYDDNYFELILSSQNIEHLHNTRLYLEECYRCLQTGGQLIVLTENLASWVNIGALLFGWQPFSTTEINGWSMGNPLRQLTDEPKDIESIEKLQNAGVSGTVGHIRVLTYKGLMDLMKKAGFKNIEFYSRGYLPFWGTISDLLCFINKKHGHFLIARGYK